MEQILLEQKKLQLHNIVEKNSSFWAIMGQNIYNVPYMLIT
jgi:hypothetical protein